MWIKSLFIILGFSIVHSFAVSSSEVLSNIDDIKNNIRQINKDLNSKKLQKKNLDQAISNSGAAIERYEGLLNQLENQQIQDQQQLDKIAAMLPIVTQSVNQAESSVRLLMNKTYLQVQKLKNSSSSLLSGNDNLANNQKKIYLLKFLNQESNKYRSLQTELSQLNVLNQKLTLEIAKINGQLGNVTNRKDKLQESLTINTNQAKSLKNAINSEKQKLISLKQQQAQLNRVLSELGQDDENNSTSKGSSVDEGYEDNSPFFKRSLVKPIDGKIIMAFGVMKNQTRNHGLLFEASNTSVYSISNGRVLYSGTLPGFGQIIVINNGDNYVSIYGGILKKVAKGDGVKRGEVIADSGDKSNQPMGGVYFELRHYGKPVNPSRLIN